MILQHIKSSEYVQKSQSNVLVCRFSQGFDSIHREKMEQILLAYSLPKETIIAILMPYKGPKAMVRLPNGDKDPFDIVAGFLQEHTLVQFLLIICLDYIL